MNLIEAIKTGKPIRRQSWNEPRWYESKENPHAQSVELRWVDSTSHYGGVRVLTLKDVTADDWEALFHNSAQPIPTIRVIVDSSLEPDEWRLVVPRPVRVSYAKEDHS